MFGRKRHSSSGLPADTNLPFACQCGQVGGHVCRAEPWQGDHVVCYCTDCQYFARHFDAADRILDRNGGTALFQSRCARMKIDRGRDRLACIHLSDKPTLRWYAQCCKTPLFNTYATGSIPYVTTLLGNCDVSRADDLLGQPDGHLFIAEATGALGPVREMPVSKLMRHFFVRMVKDVLSGDRRRSVLFDAATLQPIVQPYRLSRRETL